MGVAFGLVVLTLSSGFLSEGWSSLEMESFDAPAWSSVGGLFCTWFFAATVPFPLRLLGMMSLSNILSTRALLEPVIVRLACLVQVKVQNLCRQPHEVHTCLQTAT